MPATRRPTDAAHRPPDGPAPPAELLELPWIDPHNHAHTLSWGDREQYALSGCAGMVMVASGIHWTPYTPARAADVRFLWDDAVNRLGPIRRDHGFDARLAVGVQTGARVEDPEALLDSMADYLSMASVVAVGETGVTPAQHVEPWPLAGQREVVERQMGLAADHDLPVVLHTPNASVDANTDVREGLGVPGYERHVGLAAEPVIEGEDAAVEAVRIDVEAAADAGLPEERIVASHADPHNAPFLAEETDCYLSFTLGHGWLTGTTAETVAAAIEAYGPERIMIDSDCANVVRSDPLSVKRAILQLYRLGVDVEDIRRVVWENPRDVFGIGARR